MDIDASSFNNPGIRERQRQRDRRIGNAAAEKGIDIAVKIFIRKAWLRRKDTRIHLNTLLGRTDV